MDRNPEDKSITDRAQTMEKLQRIEWMLAGASKRVFIAALESPAYGDLTSLNTSRTILDHVGREMLEDLVADYLRLLATSSAVYEKNGDYALGISTSGWCRFLDMSSRKLCETDDNAQALRSGKWLCHESCWTKASKVAIESNAPVDIACNGGLRIFAIPIHAGGVVVGSLNFGYGDPPRSKARLRELAATYEVDENELRALAEQYESRPQFIIDVAKERLFTSARMIGLITESKRIEEALRTSELRLRLAHKATNDVVWDWDILRDMQQWNESGRIVFGWTEIVDGPVNAHWWVERVHPEDRQRVDDGFFAVVNNPHLNFWKAEYRFRKADGEYADVIDRGYVLRDEQGKAIRMIGAMLDITERKRAEDERGEFDRQLAKLQKLESLGILAGGIAHDFNNLLGGIFGYIDMAFEETRERTVANYLSSALATIDRARALTGQLLTFAKGGTPIRRLERLAPLLEETAKFALSGANVSCRFSLPENLWACEYDRNQIAQVIDNIVINALQAMPEGGVIEIAASNFRLSEKSHPALSGGNYVKIEIEDHGIGMPKEILPKIFDPFLTTKAKGHGLGLATCHSIVKRHDGWIDVESCPGRGSTFTIFLPALPDAETVDSATSPAAHRGTGLVLVMDDEQVMRDILSVMLEAMGYKVYCASNSKEAIELFNRSVQAESRFVAAILDLTIPGGAGGKETIQEIRKIDRDIPVFVSSGYADDSAMARPADHGFNGSICKPFKKAELAELLSLHIKNAR